MEDVAAFAAPPWWKFLRELRGGQRFGAEDAEETGFDAGVALRDALLLMFAAEDNPLGPAVARVAALEGDAIAVDRRRRRGWLDRLQNPAQFKTGSVAD